MGKMIIKSRVLEENGIKRSYAAVFKYLSMLIIIPYLYILLTKIFSLQTTLIVCLSINMIDLLRKYKSFTLKNTFENIILFLLLVFCYYSNSKNLFYYYPIFVSSFLLLYFVSSLYKEETVIEKYARKLKPNFPEKGKAYCRNLTKMWSLFFIVNIILAFYSLKDEYTWILYNGIISYIIIGVLIFGEVILRKRFIS